MDSPPDGAKPLGTTFALRHFTEVRGGLKLEGVTLVYDQPLVMIREQAAGGPHLVPIEGGFELTALVGPVHIEELSLQVLLTREGYGELYAAYGHAVQLTAGAPPTQAVQYRGLLELPAEKLTPMLKTVPPTGAAAERLLALVQRFPDLVNKLDGWELHGVRPLTT
jgi:hypothetical protein